MIDLSMFGSPNFSTTFESQGKRIPVQYLGGVNHPGGIRSSSMIWSVSYNMAFTPECRSNDNIYFVIEGSGHYIHKGTEHEYEAETMIIVGAGESFCLNHVESNTVILQRQQRNIKLL